MSREATIGEKLKLGQSAHGLPAFHQVGVAPSDCVTCVRFGQKLKFDGVPATVQAKFGIGHVATVAFVEDVADTSDSVMLANGTLVDLWEFIQSPQVVNLHVTVDDMLPEDDRMLMTDIIAGRKTGTIMSPCREPAMA